MTSLAELKAAFDLYDSSNISFTTAYEGTADGTEGMDGYGSGDEIAFSGGLAGGLARLLSVVLDQGARRLFITTNDGDTATQVATLVRSRTFLDSGLNTHTWGTANCVIHGTPGVDFGTVESFYNGDPGDISIRSFSGGVTEVIRTPLSAYVSAGSRLITVVAAAGDTMAEVQPVIAGMSYSDLDGDPQAWGDDNVTLTGDGALEFGSIYNPYFPAVGTFTETGEFTGGVDPEPINTILDDTAKTYTVRYDIGDTLQEINDGVGPTAAIIHGSDAAGAPESPDFTRPFRGAGGAGGSGGGGGGSPVTVTTIDPAFFHAPINTVSSAAIPQSATNYLGITVADIYTNRGAAFEVEDSTTRQRIKILKDGLYTLMVSMNFTTATGGSTRTNIVGSFEITRSGVAVAGSDGEDAQYTRNNADLGSTTAFRAVTLDLEVDDLVEFDLYQTGDNNFAAAVVAGSSISIIEHLGTVDVSGGGGGSAAGWIAPKDEYTVDDLHKFLIENGVIKEVVLHTLHAGHSRDVTMQTLADADSALDADGDEITTGDLGLFRGFFVRPGRLPTSQRTPDGSWFAATRDGAFEIQDEAGTHTSENWAAYNPFEAGAPWASVTDENGDTIAHASFDFGDGTTDYWRVDHTTAEAERSVTAVGEAFFITDEKKILMCVAYTAHADEEVEYAAVPYVGPGTVPVVEDTANVSLADPINSFRDSFILVPDTPWFFFNLGANNSSLESGEWHRVRTSQLKAKTVAAQTDLAIAANSLYFNDIAPRGDTDTLNGFDVYLGITAAGTILVASTNSAVDPSPFSIAT